MTTEAQPETQDEPLLKFFKFAHLPAGPLQMTSILFFELAMEVVATIPRSPERTVVLRKILEGKDAAVRAMLP